VKPTLRKNGMHMLSVRTVHHIDGSDVGWLLFWYTDREKWENGGDLTRAEAEEIIRTGLWLDGQHAHQTERDPDDFYGRQDQRQMFAWILRQLERLFPDLVDEARKDFAPDDAEDGEEEEL